MKFFVFLVYSALCWWLNWYLWSVCYYGAFGLVLIMWITGSSAILLGLVPGIDVDMDFSDFDIHSHGSYDRQDSNYTDD